MPGRPSILIPLLALLLSATPGASAYELVTTSGEVLQGQGVQFAGEACILETAAGPRRLAASEVDYYETFRRNALSGAGNVIVFRTGSYFRFEGIELERSRVVLGLGEQGKVTVPQGAVDFERSVQEAASLHLPRGGVRSDLVARSGGGGRQGSARSGGGDVDASSPGPGGRRGRSFNPKSVAGSARSRLDPGSRSARRLAPQDVAPPDDRFDPGPGASDFDDGGGSGGFDDTPGGGGGTPEQEEDPGRLRDGIADPEDVRRRAEEQGEPTGTVSVIVGSTDAVDVAAVQFRLRYPPNCSPVGHAPIGSFANASMSQPNGAVGGRPIFALAIVFAPDANTTLPGEIARVDFVWRGDEPLPGEFQVISATASDMTGNPVRAFRAEATVLR